MVPPGHGRYFLWGRSHQRDPGRERRRTGSWPETPGGFPGLGRLQRRSDAVPEAPEAPQWCCLQHTGSCGEAHDLPVGHLLLHDAIVRDMHEWWRSGAEEPQSTLLSTFILLLRAMSRPLHCYIEHFFRIAAETWLNYALDGERTFGTPLTDKVWRGS
ncbi:hypothetical protein NDU88_004011 [Pleurodeles waltl]|uniref:Uncharacterized protein n=1 Tax=Pleurodeles waltl TaxID=8319 RepID=A0AAV7KWI0_PLEWA|nr:hypothetical protein NDU88_004011 [Pleurodeles waltl]